ncbi:M61 family metallopeptidase [Leptolyngbya sp. NK1-12]|uniref:M61 family metallopeptidase n=1 Tax=Leptolyngbya sp. NK1-12 TaxID=2547451 RepID=A0AA97AG23_9CYAN|nr:M61 family metallopeptidase [Leptolyngbya sp. NK1-12]WNZ22979.1 M61 family metallopeptidase [Leptolyngbya sp. NK1-12]
MTEITQIRPSAATQTRLTLHYWVAMPQPESHLFEVTLQVKGWQSPTLDLKMPVWTPGSYLVREYARHVQNFSAAAEQPLTWRKLSKNHWQIDTAGISEITVRYRVFANELTVRTNHLDASHGYFNGAALFFYLPNFRQQPIRVTIQPPHSDWQVTTALSPVADQVHTFEAADFDTLVDSPFEIGQHQLYEFEVLGKPHQLAIWGQGNANPEQIIRDTQKIVQTEAELFGGLPYEHYLFLLHLSAQNFGGLEHKNSCSLIYPRFGFQPDEQYHRFMQLVAHEFFHLWNVKRIRPKALEVFDYDGENYTPSLWFSEGTTSYYDTMLPLRAGVYDARTCLKLLSKDISRFLTIPGRQVQPLSESSFDAWIKLYRRDSNSDNNQISYYLKGAMVSLLLDLLIRARHGNRRSLDDVLRQLWQQFGQPEIGFTPDQLQAVIESVAGIELSNFFHRYLDTTEELPFDQYLEPFGLRVQAENTDGLPPFLGLTVNSDNGRDLIRFVEMGSPAQQAGIDPDDELLAIDGIRVRANQLSDRLKNYRSGDTIQLTLFHQDELRTYPVTLAAPRPKNFQLAAVENPSATQQQNFQGWLGASLSSVI